MLQRRIDLHALVPQRLRREDLSAHHALHRQPQPDAHARAAPEEQRRKGRSDQCRQDPDTGSGGPLAAGRLRKKAAKALVKKQIEVSFVNLCQTSLSAKEQMIAYAKKFDCDLTFNNANFVLAGEMPFLQSYRTGHFIKFMNQLDLIDCKWDGEATFS